MKLENGILKDVVVEGVIFIVDLIPKGRLRRPCIPLNVKYVTVHNTGGNNVPADNYRRSQLDVTQDKEVSWHFTVDEKSIIQHIPINEVAWHCGSGNYSSFGIEICERNGSEQIAIKFISELLKILPVTINEVVPHFHWVNKNCPRLILPHWDDFINNIKNKLNPIDTKLIESVDRLVADNIISSPDMWNNIEKINPKFISDLIIKYVKSKLTYEQAVNILVDGKIISSEDLWLGGNVTNKNCVDLIKKL